MQPTVFNPVEVIRVLLRHPLRWLLPALVIGGAATYYAAHRPDTWQSTQTLILRNEAVNNHVGLGKFGHTDEMKALQETILELLRSPEVLRGALVEVGPTAEWREKHAEKNVTWPTRRDVADLRDALKLSPPKGAEFGTTEVFYLQVQSREPKRAIALSDAIAERLEARLRAVRDEKARGMIAELEGAVEVARVELRGANQRLSQLERTVGGDLAELRALDGATSDDSTLRQAEIQIRAELRQVQAELKANEQLRDLLEKAKADPGQLIAAPQALLASQPGLSRLKDGLIDAQINTATLQGRMSPEHPVVVAAADAENQIGQHLHDELNIALRGLETEQRVLDQRETLLNEQLDEVNARLDRLATLRADYASQVAAVGHRTDLLREVERELAEARAALAGVQGAGLISRIGHAEVGINPVGPSRAMIAAAGCIGGVLVGFGLVFLTVDLPTPSQPPTLGQVSLVSIAPMTAANANQGAHGSGAAYLGHTAYPGGDPNRVAQIATTAPTNAPLPSLGNSPGTGGLTFREALYKGETGSPTA